MMVLQVDLESVSPYSQSAPLDQSQKKTGESAAVFDLLQKKG